MPVAAVDKVFAGSIPKLYQSHFVPLIFEPYAADLAQCVARRRVSRVLEIAAGTGVVTRALDKALDEKVSIVATDLNPGRLEEARAQGTKRSVEWRQADAMALPFGDAAFDCVVCQFGVMFFPDKVHAFAEARRVLTPGGVFLFNAWDRIQDNEFADVIAHALAGLFPKDPPKFMERTPHGYNDRDAIQLDLKGAGFGKTRMDTLAVKSRGPTPQDVAIAYCQGTPWRSEIEARGSLEEATKVSAKAIEDRFGPGPVEGKIQAIVVEVEK
ncbi:MAG TPA: class I SAM-dependent methyltransferase [Usitatibacter sp.]|nr:class I SAM-dependent methyltransferase [Usitatibacter sp.]